MKRLFSLLLVLVLILPIIALTASASAIYCPKYDGAHKFGYYINRDGHFFKCACGYKKGFTPHIDPEDAKDSTCTCGHKFMDNADLSTLWLAGMNLSPRFESDETEYVGTLYTYKDITETKITARSVDAKATVELPEDLTIKKGTNTFEIKVTAEDAKTTKTYTVTVEKK